MENTNKIEKPSVLLIYPGDRNYKTGKLDKNFFPMGLLYVASVLSDMKINVSYVNLSTGELPEIINNDCLFVGFTVLTGNMILKSLDCAQIIKKSNPTIPIVFGGTHPTILPEQTLENELVDFIIIGEAEEAVREFAYELQNERQFNKIRNLGYKRNGEIIERRVLNANLSPLLAYMR